MWGDVGRCGEMWGDVGRSGEKWGDVGRSGEIWGDVGRCGEVWGDVGRDEEIRGDMGRCGEIWGERRRHGEIWGDMHSQHHLAWPASPLPPRISFSTTKKAPKPGGANAGRGARRLDGEGGGEVTAGGAGAAAAAAAAASPARADKRGGRIDAGCVSAARVAAARGVWGGCLGAAGLEVPRKCVSEACLEVSRTCLGSVSDVSRPAAREAERPDEGGAAGGRAEVERARALLGGRQVGRGLLGRRKPECAEEILGAGGRYWRVERTTV